jgi:RHS repeat-associated protein
LNTENVCVEAYRYGFNGKENDNEVKGVGDQQDYGKRIYDPRVGRFFSVDPLTTKYPFYTPYSFAGDKPTRFTDLDGAEEFDNMQQMLDRATYSWSYGNNMIGSGKNTLIHTVDNKGVEYDIWINEICVSFGGGLHMYEYTFQSLNSANVPVTFETTDQKGDDATQTLASGTEKVFAGLMAGGAALPAAPAAWELWVGANSIPEFIPYLGILGGTSAAGAGLEMIPESPTTTPDNVPATIQTEPVPDEVAAQPSNYSRRPSNFRRSTVLNAWDGMEDGSQPNTKQCPDCGADVQGNPYNRENRNILNGWDVDHDPNWDSRDLSGKTRAQILDEFNTDTRGRCRSCNRSDNQPAASSSSPSTPTKIDQ